MTYNVFCGTLNPTTTTTATATTTTTTYLPTYLYTPIDRYALRSREVHIQTAGTAKNGYAISFCSSTRPGFSQLNGENHRYNVTYQCYRIL